MINNIRLQNFRSYKDSSFEFELGANIIIGPNTSGKTNLLEAVLFLCQGKSYRVKTSQLVKNGSHWARLDGQFNEQPRTVKLEEKDGGILQTFIIGEKPYKRFTADIGLPIVYFEPEHLQLITRGPDRRRDYIDDILIRTQPGFKRLVNSYARALSQRNVLLKRGHREAAKQAFVWNVRLSELGSQIAIARHRLIKNINKNLPKTYSLIAGKKTTAKLDYLTQFDIESYASQMLSRLEKSFEQDVLQGFTSSGPHREDFRLTINKKLLAETASRGEVRSLMLALKKIEMDLVASSTDQKPLLLLDDVFSELDGSRRQALVEILKDHQAILTTTDADTVLDYFASGSHKLLALR